MFGAISDMLATLGDMFNDLGTAIGYKASTNSGIYGDEAIPLDLVDNGAATPIETLINITVMPVLDYAGALTGNVADIVREVGEMLSSF